MQITKSKKQQQQHQLQHQQPQQPQQPQQQQQQLLLQQSDQKTAPMAKVSMFKKNWVRLVAIVAMCLVLALIACGSSLRGTADGPIADLDGHLTRIQEEQMNVRKYVKEALSKFKETSSTKTTTTTATATEGDSGSKSKSSRQTLDHYLFAKIVLNAFDRPYEHVIVALEESIKASNRDGNNGGENKAKQMDRLSILIKAYGKALEDSQKYSVLIQEQIRLHQENMPNKAGEQSQVEETMRDWPLKELAEFEMNMVSFYLNLAPTEKPQG